MGFTLNGMKEIYGGGGDRSILKLECDNGCTSQYTY